MNQEDSKFSKHPDNEPVSQEDRQEEVAQSASVSGQLFEQIKILQEALDKESKACVVFKEDAMRLRADLDNYRKRSAREYERIRKAANANLIEALLPILDNFALGLQTALQNGVPSNLMEGFVMMEKQIKNLLTENGLEYINPQGEVFNPNEHECISMRPDDQIEENHVLQVVRVGYRLGEQLLRPATVIISQGKPGDQVAEE